MTTPTPHLGSGPLAGLYVFESDHDLLPPITTTAPPTPAETLLVADLLDAAAGLLRGGAGWIQGQYATATPGQNRSRFCLVGAIQHTVARAVQRGAITCERPRGQWQRWMVDAVRAAIVAAGWDGLYSLENWNDAKGRRPDEVIGVLRAAAFTARDRVDGLTDEDRETARKITARLVKEHQAATDRREPRYYQSPPPPKPAPVTKLGKAKAAARQLVGV
jgi:hypothetical protein